MPTILVYDHVKDEIHFIRDQMARMFTEEDGVDFYGVTTIHDLTSQLNDLHTISAGCADFEAEGSAAVRIIRDCDPSSMIIIIASSDTSPMLYVRPDIMAAGLLLRPLTKNQVAMTFDEAITLVRSREREQRFGDEVFTVSNREGVVRIPYSKILFFEARNKKIVVCTNRSENEFYSTLEQLSSQVPAYFLRCHKGFIVNSIFVDRVDLSNNLLHLTNGFQVPVSRSYRLTVREALT